MKLYNSVGPNPQVVRMFMAERGIEIPMEDIDIMAGEFKMETLVAAWLREGEAIHRPAHFERSAIERTGSNGLGQPVAQFLVGQIFGLRDTCKQMRDLRRAASGLYIHDRRTARPQLYTTAGLELGLGAREFELAGIDLPAAVMALP